MRKVFSLNNVNMKTKKITNNKTKKNINKMKSTIKSNSLKKRGFLLESIIMLVTDFKLVFGDHQHGIFFIQ